MIQKYKNETGARQGVYFSQEERDSMIEKYAYLVKYIAGRMASRLPSSVLFDELISAGSMGLIDAVDKYDPKREVTLKTYAQYRIKGAILDELRSMDWYSRSMRKKIQDIDTAVKSVESREGRPADENEVADEMGLALDKYQKMLSDIHGAALLSLDAYIRDDDNDSLSKNTFQAQMKSEDDPVASVSRKELKFELVKAIDALTQKEKLVVSLYYYDELTLKEIGAVLELTESRICQIHSMALVKLKSKVSSYFEK